MRKKMKKEVTSPMRLTVEMRHLAGDAVCREVNKCTVAKVFGVTWKTVHKWSKRTKHLKDRSRRKIRKITPETELFIIGV